MLAQVGVRRCLAVNQEPNRNSPANAIRSWTRLRDDRAALSRKGVKIGSAAAAALPSSPHLDSLPLLSSVNSGDRVKIATEQIPMIGTADAPTIAVLIPCFNEEASIQKVVSDYQALLPGVTVYVYDNNSRDETATLARSSGAIVRSEALQGKGNVVRRMFADIEADIYLLVDGDDTYEAAAAPDMICMLMDQQLDMVTAIRTPAAREAYRPGHEWGNKVITALVRRIFGNRVTDVLSGYRVFSRRFVKSFPALAAGFETETEFTVHALELKMPIAEIKTRYRSRSVGSSSKLRTFTDGVRILAMIVRLIKEERPLQFFCLIGLGFLLLGVLLSVPVFVEFARSRTVPRLPTAVLSTGLVLSAFLSFGCGLILDSVSRSRKEIKRLAYLALAPAFRADRLASAQRVDVTHLN
jgi:glycosyltransferase involved in cell wall biosynthesis